MSAGGPPNTFSQLLDRAIRILRRPFRGWRELDELRAIPEPFLLRSLLLLLLVPPLCGLFSSFLFGISIPVWGRWRMPFADALQYYGAFYGWLVAQGLVFRWTLMELSRESNRPLDSQAALLLTFMAFVPIGVAGVAPLLPFKFIDFLLSLGMAYSIVVFYGGLRRLMPGIESARETIFVRTTGVTILVASVTLIIVHLVLFPSYSSFSVTSVPVSNEVASLLENMENLAEMNK